MREKGKTSSCLPGSWTLLSWWELSAYTMRIKRHSLKANFSFSVFIHFSDKEKCFFNRNSEPVKWKIF